MLAFSILGAVFAALPAGAQSARIPNVGPNTELYARAWRAYLGGDGARAAALAERGLASDRRARRGAGVAEALNVLGTVRYKRGDYRRALALYREAAASASAAGYRFGIARNWSSLGSTYFRTGEYARAQSYYERSLALRRTLGEQTEIARAENDLANVLEELGDDRRALALRTDALGRWRRGGDLEGVADVLNDIGWTYDDLGDTRGALAAFRRSLALSRKIGLLETTIENVESEGVVESKTGRHAAAVRDISWAYRRYDRLGMRDDAARVLKDLGNAYMRAGAFSAALARYRAALAIDANVRDPEVEAAALSGLMEASRAIGRTKPAIFFGKQAVNVLQRMRRDQRGLSAASRRGFLRTRASTYRELADLLTADGRLGEAEAVLDLLKDEEYRTFVRGNATLGATENVPLDPSESTADVQYRRISDRITAVGAQWLALRGKSNRTPADDARLRRLSEELTTANHALEGFFHGLYAELGSGERANEAASRLREETSALRSVVRAQGAGTVAVYTIVGDHRYRAIVITPATSVAREYPIARTELARKVGALRLALQTRGDPLPAARDLYRVVVGPIAHDLEGARATTVLWSLDGVLRYVPIAALHDGSTYVVDRYNSAIVTPASLPHLRTPVAASAPRALGMGVTKNYDGLGALPGVATELHAIVASGLLPGTVMLDDAFTERAMAAGLDERYSIVHIASHFVIRPGDETASYLLLGGKENGGRGYHLSVAELRENARLTFDDTDLLTLSACETAKGTSDADGREIDGLGYVAQQKGAKSVLATLWSVNDASTAALMSDFYRRWTATPGATKAEALREAQRALLHDNRYAHPFYWAPFVLIGNPQ